MRPIGKVCEDNIKIGSNVRKNRARCEIFETGYIYIYTHTYTHTHTHTYIYIYIYTHTHTHTPISQLSKLKVLKKNLQQNMVSDTIG